MTRAKTKIYKAMDQEKIDINSDTHISLLELHTSDEFQIML